jgi:putative folate metabolism gamma-glutamate ligase
MQINSLHTHKITAADHDLLAILDRYVPELDERSILAVTSKIVAICQGRLVKSDAAEKVALIEQEADYFLPASASRYQVMLTIKENLLIPNAGVDESNADGCYVLWPHDPQAVVNAIRGHLVQKFGRRQVGVLMTDSRPAPLRWGVTGVAIAHSGFAALNDYMGRADLFGRPLRMTKTNLADALAATAVLVMGEGDEQTPLAVIRDAPFVQFQERNPAAEELASLRITLEDDLYAPLLRSVAWRSRVSMSSP